MVKSIPLTRGFSVVVDDHNYDWLNQWKWYINNSGYAVRNGTDGAKRITLIMHREIVKAAIGLQVDHINGDRLCNLESNLRICTQEQNRWNSGKRAKNTSGYKGVTWCKRNQKWLAQIRIKNHKRHLGYFQNILDAAKAYNAASLSYHGPFAWLNAV